MKTLFTIVAAFIFCFAGKLFAENLTDSQITEILKTANNAEIEAAKLAESKTSNPDVKKFANHMIKDHTENNKDTKKLEKKENIKPETSAQEQTLKKDATDKFAELKSTTKDNFDLAYINQQVAMHQQLLMDLDQTFIPSAQNSDLKLLLQNTRSHVQAHLEQAQGIQSKLK